MTDNRLQDGFTLMEVLIALALMGLIFAAVGTGLHFGTRAWDAGSARLAESAEMQRVHAVLRRQFANALPLSTPDGTESGRRFEGDADSVRFHGPAPAQAMRPGVYALTVSATGAPESRTLLLSWRDDALSGGAGLAGSEPLVGGLAGVAFSFFGDLGQGAGPAWHAAWRSTDRLPSAVRIETRFTEPTRVPWPVLTIALRTAG